MTTSEPDNVVDRTSLESTRAIPWKIDRPTATFAHIGPPIERQLGWKQDSRVTVDDRAACMHPEERAWAVDVRVKLSQRGLDHGTRDGVTGVSNRRELDAVLDEGWMLAHRIAKQAGRDLGVGAA